jgi:hypothetical protein
MQAEYREVQQFYNEYKDIIAELEALDLGINFPAVPSGLGSLDGLLAFGGLNFNTADIQAQIDAKIAAAQADAKAQAQAEFDKMNDADARMALLVDQLGKLGPVGDFSDYDPPPADPSATYAAYKRNEAEYLANMDAVLNEAGEPDLGQVRTAAFGVYVTCDM